MWASGCLSPFVDPSSYDLHPKNSFVWRPFLASYRMYAQIILVFLARLRFSGSLGAKSRVASTFANFSGRMHLPPIFAELSNTSPEDRQEG